MTALQNRVLRRLKKIYPKWLKRSDLYASLSAPVTKDILDVAVEALKKRGLIESQEVSTGDIGRPPTVYRLRKVER
jgi:hypothetical protein